MIMHYFECLGAEIQRFFWSALFWIVFYVLANYCGLRGPLGYDVTILLPFMLLHIMYNAYLRFVDEY